MTTQTISSTKDFADLLGTIRQNGERRLARDRRVTSEGATRRAEQVMDVFRYLERIERQMERFADGIRAELRPDVAVAHRVFDGRYELEAVIDEIELAPDGLPSRVRSRVRLRIAPESASGRVHVALVVTVRDHELVHDELFEDMGMAGQQAVSERLEGAFLELARGYCRAA
jgi:hypothetical protein